jgi:hypothetical protein
MYLIATPIDKNTCVICQQARGKVFSSAQRNKKGFRPLGTHCVNPAGCRCELVGLIGNWPEAERLSKTLRKSEQPPTLSESEMIALVASAGSLPSGPDRLGLYLLEALQSEGINPNFAMSRYRSLICQALEGIQHPYIVPAYMRLSDLLERSGNLTTALSVVDEFVRVAKAGLGPHSPTRLQTKVMTIRRARLLKRLKTQ